MLSEGENVVVLVESVEKSNYLWIKDSAAIWQEIVYLVTLLIGVPNMYFIKYKTILSKDDFLDYRWASFFDVELNKDYIMYLKFIIFAYGLLNRLCLKLPLQENWLQQLWP